MARVGPQRHRGEKMYTATFHKLNVYAKRQKLSSARDTLGLKNPSTKG